MDREGFRNRMKQYKEARGLNPLLKYWEWKAIPKYGDGTDLIGKKEIQWFKDWYNKRVEYAIANNRPDIIKQLESLQYEFYPKYYKYSLGVDWDNSIYTGTLDPRINNTKISINDQAIKDYEKKHGVKIGGYLHPSEGIVLPSNYNSNDLLHELAHTFNQTGSVTNAVNSAISDENGFVTIPEGLQNPEYWISPWEVHSRLMLFREENNIDPTKVYNEEDIKQLRKSAKDKILFEIFNDSQIMHLLNDVADNATTPVDDRLFLKNGGVVPKYEDGTGNVKNNLTRWEKLKATLSTGAMNLGWLFSGLSSRKKPIFSQTNAAQDSYLVDRELQQKMFENEGYTKVNNDDYGLVRKAVNNRNIPIFQKTKDAKKREDLTVLGNVYNAWYGTSETKLDNAAHHPTALYVDSDGWLYQKGWDLNDYGEASAGNSGYEYGWKQIFANAIDKIGSPTVVTTGFQPVVKSVLQPEEHLNAFNIKKRKTYADEDDMDLPYALSEYLDEMLSKKGLQRIDLGDSYTYGLPEVEVTPTKHADGGEVTDPQDEVKQKLAAYREKMRNYALNWYNERLKHPEYATQIGVSTENGPILNPNIVSTLSKDTYVEPENVVKTFGGRPVNIHGAAVQGGALPEKQIWFGKGIPAWWHEGIGHMVGDTTPGILLATPDISILTNGPKDEQYDQYINQTNEKHSSTWEFRGANVTRRDKNGNLYIDPNRKLTGEDVQEMIDSGAYIPTQWKNSSITPEQIADFHNTFASVDADKSKRSGIFMAADGGEVGDNTDYRQQIINRADYVASNYDDAKDFDLNPLVYTFRKFAKDNFDRGGISNCTLSATGWIDPNNQYMSAKNIFNNPSSGYTEIDAGYALPGDLLIAKNPEKNSYHTMLIEGFNGNEPILRYSKGGHDTKENLVTGRPLAEYHKLDNKQGGNHTEDHYFRYNIPNEYWLPELIVTPNKR